jgi:hypothetical protein
MKEWRDPAAVVANRPKNANGLNFLRQLIDMLQIFL